MNDTRKNDNKLKDIRNTWFAHHHFTKNYVLHWWLFCEIKYL